MAAGVGPGPSPEGVTPMAGADGGRIEDLRKRIEASPGSRLFLRLAEAYREQGDLDGAIEVCRAGLERNPCYHSARVSLGRLYLECGKSEEAAQELRRVLDAVPDNLLARRLLESIPTGEPDEPQRKPAPAGPAGVSSPMIDKGRDPMQTRTLAEVYLRQGLPDRAARVLEGILEAEPENAEVRERLARVRPGSPGPAAAAAGAEALRRKIGMLREWLGRIQRG